MFIKINVYLPTKICDQIGFIYAKICFANIFVYQYFCFHRLVFTKIKVFQDLCVGAMRNIALLFCYNGRVKCT